MPRRGLRHLQTVPSDAGLHYLCRLADTQIPDLDLGKAIPVTDTLRVLAVWRISYKKLRKISLPPLLLT